MQVGEIVQLVCSNISSMKTVDEFRSTFIVGLIYSWFVLVQISTFSKSQIVFYRFIQKNMYQKLVHDYQYECHFSASFI
jgi:hypothetical protein